MPHLPDNSQLPFILCHLAQFLTKMITQNKKPKFAYNCIFIAQLNCILVPQLYEQYSILCYKLPYTPKVQVIGTTEETRCTATAPQKSYTAYRVRNVKLEPGHSGEPSVLCSFVFTLSSKVGDQGISMQ